MLILVYSPVAEGALKSSLGKPEYSYLFVLRRFLPVLEQIGEVQIVERAEEVDNVVRHHQEQGRTDLVFISFAPPNRTPDPPPCSSISVFAWEFDTLPDEAWGGEWREDWTAVLRQFSAAVTLSTHSREVTSRAMGPEFPVFAIPAPIFDRFSVPDNENGKSPSVGRRSLAFSGIVMDNREFDVSEQGLTHTKPMERFCERDWGGEWIHMAFGSEDENRGRLVGFYMSEAWGAWSQLQQPWVLLPVAVVGKVTLTLRAAGYASNADRDITVVLGDCERTLRLTEQFQRLRLTFDVSEPANTIVFKGLTVEQKPDSLDVRSMGIGLCYIELDRPAPAAVRSMRRASRRIRRVKTGAGALAVSEPRGQRDQLDLTGVVYSSVLNPNDGRKRWDDIVSAFGWAFRDIPDVTLLLKMTHHSLASYLRTFQFTLYRLGPVKCRIVAIQGYMSESELAQLVELSTYYVNASEAEGLCMPAMEFLSAGVPAVAPDHSAMADYIDRDCAFVLEHSLIPALWPHDERGLWRSTKNTVHWDSLVEEFRASYHVAMQDPERYQRMSRAAVDRQRALCSDEVVRAELLNVLDPSKLTATR